MARAGPMSMERIHADGCGLRSVTPHSMPSSHRSEAYANSPVTLSAPSGLSTLAPMPARRPVSVVMARPRSSVGMRLYRKYSRHRGRALWAQIMECAPCRVSALVASSKYAEGVRLRERLAIPELRLGLLTPDDHADPELTGVIVTDLPDPGRYLSGGELVLTGLMWRQEPADSERFADALVRAGVAALGAGAARLGTVPGDLVAACRARGLPLFEVPVEVSFGSIIEIVGAPLARIRAGELRGALGR